MLSSNNWKEQFRKQEPKKQRFTIKKLTIGVASVLIGFTFMGMSVSANTTTGTSDVNNQTAESTQTNTGSRQANSDQATLKNVNSADNTESQNKNTTDNG